MKADTVDLAAMLGKPILYTVPLFQRPDVWNMEEQWESLPEDRLAVADRQLDGTRSDAIPHFLHLGSSGVVGVDRSEADDSRG